MSKVLYLLFFVTIFFRPVMTLYQHFDSMFARNYNYPLYYHLYYNSQYVKKDNPGLIPDQTLEGFIAGAFLYGVDSTTVIHDQPPLGRYINAFSIFIFNNVSTISKFLLIVSLIGLILVSQEVIGTNWMALLPVALFANESLFFSKTSLSFLLEPVQLPFIIFCIYFFLKGIKGSSRWLILCSIMLGFVISIRYFVLGLALFACFTAVFLVRRKLIKKFKIFILTLPLSILVLFVSYFKTIQNGKSLWDIIKIQNYIFAYHQSAITLPFSFWDLLLFNRWHTWWGHFRILSDAEWNIIWPISVLIIFLGILKTIFSKMKLSESQCVIFLWILFYTLMLSVGYSSTRYFLPLVPFLYILAVSFIRVE